VLGGHDDLQNFLPIRRAEDLARLTDALRMAGLLD